ncbi:MAG TPA: class I SAM-dependent methyltransferase [Acidimicrobiales bacterium]|nr:class I SAM-dependent methyltransferase [Acidimicrobiales bacterium]
MSRPLHEAAFDQLQRATVSVAARYPSARRAMARAGRGLSEAAARGGALAEARSSGVGHLYQGSYFGEGRDPSGDRAGRSGYARYDRIASNADIAGWLLWRNFRVRNSLDVGCATGYLVEVLRELGVDADGCDVSAYAVDHPAPGAAGHLRVAGLLSGLPWPDGRFELVTALETLEHLPPDRVHAAIGELRRVCSAYVYATIPSFGGNVSGPDGHFEGKVRPERVAEYIARGADYTGPVPEADLARDADGRPVEGHLTIASFGWWTERFAEAGLTRCPDVEQRLYADIEPADLAPFWNLYVFRVPGAPDGICEPRQPDRTLAELGLRHPLLEAASA